MDDENEDISDLGEEEEEEDTPAQQLGGERKTLRITSAQSTPLTPYDKQRDPKRYEELVSQLSSQPPHPTSPQLLPNPNLLLSEPLTDLVTEIGKLEENAKRADQLITKEILELKKQVFDLTSREDKLSLELASLDEALETRRAELVPKTRIFDPYQRDVAVQVLDALDRTVLSESNSRLGFKFQVLTAELDTKIQYIFPSNLESKLADIQKQLKEKSEIILRRANSYPSFISPYYLSDCVEPIGEALSACFYTFNLRQTLHQLCAKNGVFDFCLCPYHFTQVDFIFPELNILSWEQKLGSKFRLCKIYRGYLTNENTSDGTD